MSKGTFLSWIVVSDIKQARRFFVEVLGYKELTFDEGYKWGEFMGKEGGSIVGVCEKDPHNPIDPGSNAILTIQVDDIEKSKKDLSNKGVKMLGDIVEVPGHVKMQTFADKDGNTFQLCEKLD